MKDFTELDVWIKAKDLAGSVYKVSEKFPPKENYRLIDQICRASISVPSNIAEGIGRNTVKEKTHFLYIARGSAFEVETQLHIAFDLGYISEEELRTLKSEVVTVKKLINGFIGFMKKTNP